MQVNHILITNNLNRLYFIDTFSCLIPFYIIIHFHVYIARNKSKIKSTSILWKSWIEKKKIEENGGKKMRLVKTSCNLTLLDFPLIHPAKKFYYPSRHCWHSRLPYYFSIADARSRRQVLFLHNRAHVHNARMQSSPICFYKIILASHV